MAYTVYELLNPRLQKVFIGFTGLPIDAVLTEHRVRRDPRLADWQDGELLSLKIVELFPEREEGRLFFERYASKKPPPGWQYIADVK